MENRYLECERSTNLGLTPNWSATHCWAKYWRSSLLTTVDRALKSCGYLDTGQGQREAAHRKRRRNVPWVWASKHAQGHSPPQGSHHCHCHCCHSQQVYSEVPDVQLVVHWHWCLVTCHTVKSLCMAASLSRCLLIINICLMASCLFDWWYGLLTAVTWQDSVISEQSPPGAPKSSIWWW